MWDIYGLECVFDVDEANRVINEWEKLKLFSILKEENALPQKPNPIPLQAMILRATANPQRHYEIYGFTSTIPMPEIKEIFRDSPQILVDWIRGNGTKIYSHRNDPNKQVIS